MKKFWTSSLLFLAAGASAMGLASCNLFNALGYTDERLKGEEGLIFALTQTQQSYAVTGYIGESEWVEIPQTYQNLPVTEISGWAFNGKESVKGITIPESVTTIGDCAFSACVNLESVDFRARVTRLGESVFGSCSSLQQLVLPDGVQTIDDNAFILCENLQQIILPNTVTEIGTGVFDSCVKLSNVYYKGTQAQWGNLSIAQNNGALAAATTYYFSEEKPDDDADGDYWHYSAEGLVQNWILRSDGLVFLLNDTETAYSIGGYTGADKDVVIPSKYNGKPVTKIENNAFRDKDITSVKFPQTLQSIDYNAFGGCESLTSVTLPDNLTELGSNVFASSGVQSLTLPANMTHVPANAFMYMFNLKHISFPDSVIEIGENAFLETGLETVDFNNVQKIENYAFYNTQLTRVDIPDCTNYIGQSAFGNCTSLQRIILGTGVERISGAFVDIAPNAEIYYKGTLSEYANVTGSANYNAFTYAATQPQGDGRYWYYNNGEITKWRWQTLGLQYINVADGYRQGYAVCGYTGGESEVVIPSIFQGQPVVEIYEEAFADKTHVTSISLPDSIVCIKEGAFRNCTGLLSLVIPDAVAYIQTGAFSGCTSLQSLTLPKPNGYLHDDFTWRYTTSFASIFGTDYCDTSKCTIVTQEYHIELNNDTYVGTYYVPNSLTNVTITGGDLAYGTFMNCISLQTITLPTSITQIPESAFQACTGLQTLNVGTLTSVGDYAFQSCASLTGLGLSSLTNIGVAAFGGCASLQSANLLSAQTIGNSAFSECTALQSVQLPDGLTFVDAYMLEGCTSLQAVAIPEGIESIGYGAFRGCTQLSQVSLPSTLTIIGNYAFEGCTALETLELPLGLEQIDPQAFLGAGLTSIVVPNTVTNIGEGAFGGCWNLQSITLPFVGNTALSSSDSNQYPLGYIFGTTSVEYVEPSTIQMYYESYGSFTQGWYYIPSSLKSVTVTGGSILAGAFYNCSHLEEIILEEGVVAGIYAYAFQSNSSLTHIVLPDSVEMIDAFAFASCSSLESIVLPADLQRIGQSAFSACDNLQAVYYRGTQAVGCFEGNEAFSNADAYFYSETRPATAENCWHYTPEGEIVIWEPGSDGLLFEEYDTYYTVTGYEGTDTEVFIPSSHNGKPITQIAEWAFLDNTAITAVHLPEHLQLIEYNAFQGATALQEVFLPAGIQYIYSGAFNGCASLTYAYYYGSVQSWQNVTVGANNSALSSNIYCYSEERPETEGNFWAYKEDGSIRIWGLGTEGLQFTMWNGTYGISGYTGTDTEIVIPDTYQGVAVTAIGGRAFEDRADITSVELGVNVESIGVCAFINCTSLQTIIFNDNLRVIYDEAFRGCNAFTEFEIPASVTQLGFGIFSGWNRLESLTLQFMGGSEKTENDTYQYPLGYLFGAESFSGGVATEQFFPQSSATSDEPLTYYIPSSLQSVTLKRGHVSLGAFYNCTNLLSVTLEDEVTSIGKYAFFNCSSLTDIDLGEGVQSIDYLAFKNCRALTNIIVPTSVTSIADGAFSLCVGLEEITLPFVGNSAKTSSQTYQYPFGYIFGLASDGWATATTQYYYASSISSTTSSTYYIPNSLRKVTILGGNVLRGAFQNCAIETIIFGENVGSISAYAFQNATMNNFAYKGSEYEWTANRSISSTGNSILSSANFFYNYGATTATYSFVSDNSEACAPIQSSEIINLPTPDKGGYEFKGWYTNSSFTGTAYFTSFYATQDTVLYAKWESSADGTSFAKAITVSTGSVTVNIQTGGQRVYFKFVPTTTRTYTIYSTGSHDTYGYLYNASQSQLTYDDDAGDASNFKISYTLTAGNTYYIVARMWSSSRTGSYTMTIS